MKRKFKIILIVLLLFPLVACGKKESDTDKDGKKILKLATWANEREARELNEILDTLNENSDEYTIEHVLIPEDYYTKVQTMVAGNSAPDLIWLSQEYIPAYASNNAVIDLTDMLENQDIVDIDDYFEGPLETAVWEDKIYGLPWIGQPYVVYYNKDLFEANGLGTPATDWTWDDFSDTAKQLTHDGVYGFGNTGSLPSSVLAWAYGGDTVTSDGDILLNNDNTIAGFEKLYEMQSNKEMTMPFVEAESLGVEEGFINGKIGMFVGGANDDVEEKVADSENPFEVGMAMIPAGPDSQITFNWTASTLIMEQTKDKELAFEALLDLTDAIFDWKVPVPIKSKADTIKEVNPNKAYAYDVIRESMEIARGFNNLPQQNELGNKQWLILDQPIISNNDSKGNVDVSSSLNKLQEEFEKILK